jgi:hypothetical protein
MDWFFCSSRPDRSSRTSRPYFVNSFHISHNCVAASTKTFVPPQNNFDSDPFLVKTAEVSKRNISSGPAQIPSMARSQKRESPPAKQLLKGEKRFDSALRSQNPGERSVLGNYLAG